MEKKNYYEFSAEYNFGDRVYHATRDGDEGIVTDVIYYVGSGRVKYEVAFGRRSEDTTWCYSEELSPVKIF